MREIKLWYNRNREKIWKIVGIVAVIIIIVQLLRWMAVRSQNEKQANWLMTENKNNSNLNSIVVNEDKSTVTGESLTNTQTNSLTVIDKFIEYCNNKQMNEAYNLLTKECKSEMYPTVTEFQKNYYNKIFNGKAKNISVENWVGNIYKVKFTEDALSTGIYDSKNVIQDYITIVGDKEKGYELNINGYIGKTSENEEKEAFDINVQVLEKHQYMDFTTYVFKVTNNSKNTILLNDMENVESMYLEDRNGIKYSAYTNEISEADMRLLPGETKNVKIKYYNKYSSTKKISKIVFSEIALGGNEVAKFEISL